MFYPGKEPFTAKLGRFMGTVIAACISAFIVILLIVLMAKFLIWFV